MLLPTAYLGNIHYFSKLAGAQPHGQSPPATANHALRNTDAGEIFIEACENFQRQTCRNRAAVMTAGGVRALTVPVVWRHHEKMPVRDVRIDHTLPWQREHLRTLKAAYASAPYFDHYFGVLEPFYSAARRPEFLFDLNAALTEVLLKMLKLPGGLKFSETYTPAATLQAGEDLRGRISRKPELHATEDPSFRAPHYWQVFADRQPFAPNLSVVDLLFCEGPGSKDVLLQSRA